MSALCRFVWSITVALIGVAACVSSMSAQPAGTGNPYTPPPTQAPYNLATLGRNQSLGLGYDPIVNPYLTTTGSVPTVAPPRSSGPPMNFGGFGGFGYPQQILMGRGGELQGYASMISATGQYYQDIQQARITREQSRQMSYETTKQRLTLEMQYEDMKRIRYKQDIAFNRQAVLDKARTDPQDTDIWSGMTLNVLLKSILLAPAPTRGPNIPLSDYILGGLNLTDGVNRGSLAMAKDEGKIDWTDALEDGRFDTTRKRFSENFAMAMKAAQSGEMSNRATLNDLRADLKTLGNLLDEEVATLSPSGYIESRRLLNKLKDAVLGLSTNTIVASCNASWKKDVRTVADLVSYCQQKGLEFGPAGAQGDKARYQAAYQAIRAYERGVVQLAAAP